MKTIKKAFNSTTGFVKDHKVGLALIVGATAGIALSAAALSNPDSPLGKELGNYTSDRYFLPEVA